MYRYNSILIEKIEQKSTYDGVYITLDIPMNMEDSQKKTYQERYMDQGSENSLLVSTKTPGSKVLSLFDFKKDGDIYPDFKDAYVTDIGGGLSTLAFELSPSARQIIVVDPMYGYDSGDRIEQEKKRAEHRLLDDTEKFQQQRRKDLTDILSCEKEIVYGIQKRKETAITPDPKIIVNTSFAQDLTGIHPDSQDAVFFNFVLDKLYKGDLSLRAERDALEAEVSKAVGKAYDITKPGGKIYGVHDRGIRDENSDAIANVLDSGSYQRKGFHKDGYIIFIIDKK